MRPERAEAKENLSGRDAYRATAWSRCSRSMERGGSVVWGGPQKFVIIGDDSATTGTRWCACAIPRAKRS